jgi:hypothetical protein
MSDIDYLNALRGAILIRHGCKANHKRTIYVNEQTVEKETMWEGNVEEFDLVGHKRAKTCYAWLSVGEEGKTKIFTVLKNRVINSATKAVQAAIFVDAQPPVHEPMKRRRSEQGCKESHDYVLEPAVYAFG